ncbi:6,7-dimethyl-8-ribityllumazine synthase [bacterium]|nr:MAG: 6,7-dimethyl-8-ribityllumazine synthase [bacterium]
MPTIEGVYTVKKTAKIAIVAGRFNEFVVGHLIDGALDCLKRHKLSEKAVTIHWCPGSFEIPLVAKKVAESKKYDAVICLGAVIRGDTPHFEYVSAEVSKGIANVALETGVPIIYGILTTDTIDQAIERSGTKAGNRGFTAALDALEMINLVEAIPKRRRRRRPKKEPGTNSGE